VSVIVDLRFTRRETKGWTVGLKVAKIATQRPTAWTIKMLDFNDFFYFVQVVDRGGFTAAGRTLRIPKSTLSHRIQQLEANLGVRLLNRTSRRFGVDDWGSNVASSSEGSIPRWFGSPHTLVCDALCI
jgi:hypothetical protein